MQMESLVSGPAGAAGWSPLRPDRPADGPLLRRMASTTVFFSEYMIPTAGSQAGRGNP